MEENAQDKLLKNINILTRFKYLDTGLLLTLAMVAAERRKRLPPS